VIAQQRQRAASSQHCDGDGEQRLQLAAAAAARHYDKQREQTSAETVDCFQLSLIA